MEQERPRVELRHAVCPFCKVSVRPEQGKVACDSCMAWHHRECWTDHGACSACGFATVSGATGTPATHPRTTSTNIRPCSIDRCFEPATRSSEMRIGAVSISAGRCVVRSSAARSQPTLPPFSSFHLGRALSSWQHRSPVSRGWRGHLRLWFS